MRYIAGTAVVALLLVVGSSSQVAAQETTVDLSKPLICATVEAIDCGAGDGCDKGGPAEFGAPNFMRIDLQKKAVVGPKRTSAIHYMDKNEDRVTLQGTELGFAWTLVVDKQGKMTATLADQAGVFVLFGSCTPL